MTESLQKYEAKEIANSDGAFQSAANFELAQRMAKMLASSQLVPQNFRGNIADCVIALEMANRIGASPMAVLQNMYIVHGKPAWSSQFLIACLNASGKFSPMRYKMGGEEGGDNRSCIAWAKDLNDGDVLEGPKVSMAMAKAEGWMSKNGSKWQTMPELMLRYRAATFFARLHAPEITMGILTNEEVIDITPGVVETPAARNETPPANRTAALLDTLKADSGKKEATPFDVRKDAQNATAGDDANEKPPTQAEITAKLGVPSTVLTEYCTDQGWTRGSFQGVDEHHRRDLINNAEQYKLDISAWLDDRDNQ